MLVIVALICAALAAFVSVFETTTPSIAKAKPQAPTRIEQLEPVRIIGTPFIPNTKPGKR